jgi:hypothetical protein
MAVLSFTDSTLAVLRPLWPEYELWVVPCSRPSSDVWCARRTGEETACINAASPEELVGKLHELDAQP